MRVVVVFDILEEYREVRDELREYLKDFGGEFLQYSVYEVELDREALEELVRGVGRILKKGGGRVDVLVLCRKCYSGIRVLDTYGT